MFRLRSVVIVMVVALVTTGCGEGPTMTPAECRQTFADHAQYLGENGNPGTDLTPRLTGRWDEMDAELARLATSATSGDCPSTLDHYKLESKRLEAVLFAVAPFDMAQALIGAEADLSHAREMQAGFTPDRKLRRAFAALRENIPAARRSLAPSFAKVDALDPLDADAVKAAVNELASFAAADSAYRKVQSALAVIADYELHEE